MGLSTSHDCWQGAYSAFHRFRQALAKAAGLPRLDMMEGFWSAPNDESLSGGYWFGHGLKIIRASREPAAALAAEKIAEVFAELPIKWEWMHPRPLIAFLHHSDCEGEIPAADCAALADDMETLLPELEKLPEGGGHLVNVADAARRFIAGLRRAAAAGEPVGFH